MNPRAEAARRNTAIVCAKRLNAAADALAAHAMACSECNDASSPRGADDSRAILATNMREYASWLEDAYKETK
jgi:hypothetical protein